MLPWESGIWECLTSVRNVSNYIRQEIEETLSLPIEQIEKYKTQKRQKVIQNTSKYNQNQSNLSLGSQAV